MGSKIKVGRYEWPVAGIFSANGGVAESEIWTDAKVLQDAYHRGDSFQSVYVKLNSPGAFQEFKDSLTSNPQLSVKVVRQSEYYAEQSQTMTRLITTLGFLIAFLMAVGAVFGALNTMYSAVSTRTREIATLRALGFGRAAVVVSLMMESLLLALAGGVLGGGLAYFAFNNFHTSTMNFQSFSQVTFAFRVTPELLVRGIVWSALIGLMVACSRPFAPRACPSRRVAGTVTGARSGRREIAPNEFALCPPRTGHRTKIHGVATIKLRPAVPFIIFRDMKSHCFHIGLAMFIFSFASTTLADPANPPRERVSLDAGWRFARFGPMPDGSLQPEPGQPAQAVTAASEEINSGNNAAMAIDGDSNTRWCAADGSLNQWLAVDFGKVTSLGSVEIEWENPLAYQFKIEVSDDGKTWKIAADRTQNHDAARLDKVALDSAGRLVRVTVTGLPEGKWASISELRVFDTAGKQLQPVAPKDAAAATPESVTFNDSGWRKLNLPHDWGIEGPFKQAYPGETGKLPWWGIGWYRKHLEIPAADQGRKIYLDVDGAMSYAKVWLNGQYVGGWPYGYASWRVDLTPFVKCGGDNVIAIRLDNPPESSRWYPGGGIYRNVWLVKTAPVHVGALGHVRHHAGDQRHGATVKIQVRLENDTASDSVVTVNNEIFELGADGAKGKSIASLATAGVEVAAHQSQVTTRPDCRSQSEIVEPREAAALRRGDLPGTGRQAGGQLRNALWHPHHPIHGGQRISAERQTGAAERRLRPS